MNLQNIKFITIKSLLLFSFTFFCLVVTAHAEDQKGEKKRYMLEGISTPAVFASIIAKPQDRGPNAAGLIKKVGCELLDYYVGIHNYKNYVIIECTAKADIAALQLTMFASGGVASGTATEIVTSAGLKAVGERAQKISKTYKLPE